VRPVRGADPPFRCPMPTCVDGDRQQKSSEGYRALGRLSVPTPGVLHVTGVQSAGCRSSEVRLRRRRGGRALRQPSASWEFVAVDDRGSGIRGADLLLPGRSPVPPSAPVPCPCRPSPGTASRRSSGRSVGPRGPETVHPGSRTGRNPGAMRYPRGDTLHTHTASAVVAAAQKCGRRRRMLGSPSPRMWSGGARVTPLTEADLGSGSSGRSLSWLNFFGRRSPEYHRLCQLGLERHRTCA
jgi:hypothetical protein